MKSYVLAQYVLAVILLLAAVLAPAFAGSQVIAISTRQELYGAPPFLRVSYTYEQGRRFAEASVYPQMLLVYSSASALLGLAAGGVLAWRRHPQATSLPSPGA